MAAPKPPSRQPASPKKPPAKSYTLEFSRYHDLLSQIAHTALRDVDPAHFLGKPASPDRSTPNDPTQNPASSSPSVDLAIPAAKLLLDDNPNWHTPLGHSMMQICSACQSAVGSTTAANPVLMDGSGAHRAEYGLLAIHLHLAAFAKRYESLSHKVWALCEATLDPIGDIARSAIENHAATPPPPKASPRVLWYALILAQHAALTSRDVDVDLVDAVVHQIASRPGPEGSLHPLTRSAPTDVNAPGQPIAATGQVDSLDAWTYRELFGLHALANLALARRNHYWVKRVEQIALYHLDHTQPDHITCQPWALFAFIWSPKTRLFADQQIHDTMTQPATSSASSAGDLPATPLPRPGVLIGLLITDAATALSAFLSPTNNIMTAESRS